MYHFSTSKLLSYMYVEHWQHTIDANTLRRLLNMDRSIACGVWQAYYIWVPSEAQHTHQVLTAFLECEYIQSFWLEMENWMSNIRNCRIRLDQIQKIFGDRDLNFEVNLIILAAKKTIYKCRLKGKIPCCNMTKSDVKQYLNCLRYNLKTTQIGRKTVRYKKR